MYINRNKHLYWGRRKNCRNLQVGEGAVGAQRAYCYNGHMIKKCVLKVLNFFPFEIKHLCFLGEGNQ